MIEVTQSVDSEDYPTATYLKDGGFFVAWKTTKNLLFGQEFDKRGVKIGGPFTIFDNISSQIHIDHIRLESLKDGRVVVLWEMWGGSYHTGGVYFRILTL